MTTREKLSALLNKSGDDEDLRQVLMDVYELLQVVFGDDKFNPRLISDEQFSQLPLDLIRCLLNLRDDVLEQPREFWNALLEELARD